MKHLLTTLLLATLCATGYGQTLKSVMIDTNGVQVNQFGSGSATNPAIKLGATNWGFWRATGPDRIFVSVNGSTGVTFTSNSVAATTFSGNLSGGVTIGSGQSISFSGGANVSGTRTNLGLGWPALTNTNAATVLLGINASNQVVASTNIIFTNGVAFTTNAAAATLANLGLGTNASVTISNLNVQSVSITNADTFRTNISIPLPALTNTSNVTMMRALAGSTNTNEPWSGVIELTDGSQGWSLSFSNGILLSIDPT
jgi:hypothetical protein